MSVLRLSHFPDLCLLAIFARIPLLDVIRTVGGVCKNWSRLQKEELSQRRILGFYQNQFSESFYEHLKKIDSFGSTKLIEQVRRDDGSPWERVQSPNQIKHSVLRMPCDVLTEEFTTRLMKILPRITHLIVKQHVSIFSVNSVVGQMIRLLEHHSTRLVCLKINFAFYYGVDELSDRDMNKLETNVIALFDCINRLESLRHLTLNVNYRDIKKIWPKINLSILSRLTTFCALENWLSFSMLVQYANEGNVRFNCDRVCSLEELLLVDQNLANKFIRVHVRNTINVKDYERTQLLCVRFSSLITLRLENLDSMPMSMLARCLSKLTQLIYLDVKIISQIPDDEQAFAIVQVPSVRLLRLTICTESHLDTEHLQLAEIFPNLQVLHLTNFCEKCSECSLDSRKLKEEPELRPQFVHCMHQSRQPFRHCANLHTVKLDSWVKRNFVVKVKIPKRNDICE